ncbi:rho guanine nucleotide exchange factor 16-like [Megalops cyprinoides]|uniref:rho guanine nucleotide exchange factor 16-like n=1 Tax=Megalops cyprinoides TaxID=118141 RepID=UPI001864D122|nr:rho guanine nucleotide exchange factor 16-like [Megalops cyprinoides]
MSLGQSDGSMGDQTPLILENRFSSDLRLDCISEDMANSPSQSQGRASRGELSLAKPSEGREKKGVVLSTESPAALKRGTQQLIPRSLAVSSRTKTRHHTTVITLPVALEAPKDKRASAPVSDLSWEDYDSDGEGFSLRRNRRNKSYRAAVKSLNPDAMTPIQESATLRPVREERAASPQPARSPRRNKTALGRKRNQKHRGSFKDEPRLYQEIRERGLHSNNQNTDDDLLEAPPEPDQGIVVKNYRPAQRTWSQLPQVQESGILKMISVEERKRQEAIFEIITSEYSYKHSLDILVRHFKGSEELRRTMTATEHHHLFSNIVDIQAASKRFFEALESRHHDNPLIRDISDIMQDHATHHFQPYIIYCSNETFQQRALQKLLTSNTAFKEVLKQIEMSSECGGLPMISFLILPMQRVTRLPLLMDTICQKTPAQTAEYFASVWALKAISKLVKKCNEGARTMERTEQMYTIQKQMDFGKIKPFPLVSASRWLLKRGELPVRTEDLSIFWKAFSSKSYFLFLFNDVLILTRKKSEESYVVMDYATLENVEVELEQSDGQPSPTTKERGSAPCSLRLLMKRNSEGRAEQISLVAESQIERARWVTALQQHKQVDSYINKEDLPQCEVTKAHMPRESDELGLQQAEVVIILQEEDGWYYGERMRDGGRGWFPASCATEITDRTAVELNVRRMERLLKETNV